MECMGGNGYMEDATDLPALFRTQQVGNCTFHLSFLNSFQDLNILEVRISDTVFIKRPQVNTIWEGTTNILSLDLQRAILYHPGSVVEYRKAVERVIISAHVPPALSSAVARIRQPYTFKLYLLNPFI